MSADANIKVYLRIRPSKNPSSLLKVDDEDSTLEIIKPSSNSGLINNQKTDFSFKFSHVFEPDVKQQQVFQKVAVDTIEDVLNGINATIFAYGQTGSGKTFTMTGGTERYEDRGLIPRTISHLFSEIKKLTQEQGSQFRLMISYLEIYNDQGYDLLSTSETQCRKLEDLPKVRMREDEAGNIEMRNLSVNLADSEQEALRLLFLGDTNRVIADTPMNDASTRSHCLFIIWVEHKLPNSDVVRRAKLHLVDLAGSERVFKTGATCADKVMKEACSINLALFHLEKVISELHTKSHHISYRNSTMTKVLKDSLGGNCKTRMIATCSAEQQFIDETISTCRFAQSVAAIKNYAKINEDLDPKAAISRLKAQIKELKEEIKILRGETDSSDSSELNDAERIECARMVDAFVLAPSISDAPVPMSANPKIMRACFHILRERLLMSSINSVNVPNGGAFSHLPNHLVTKNGASAETLEELEDAQEMIRMKDVEISALVNRVAKLEEMLADGGNVGNQAFPTNCSLNARTNSVAAIATSNSTSTRISPTPQPLFLDCGREARLQATAAVCQLADHDPQLMRLAQDREAAWAEFQRTYCRAEEYQALLQRLKSLCEEVKMVANEATVHRAEAARLTQELARQKFERGDDSIEDESMKRVRDGVEVHAGKYRMKTNDLREKKKEVEHLKHQIVTQSAQMQAQFAKWWDHLSTVRSAISPSRVEQPTSFPTATTGTRQLEVPYNQASVSRPQSGVPAVRQLTEVENRNREYTPRVKTARPEDFNQDGYYIGPVSVFRGKEENSNKSSTSNEHQQPSIPHSQSRLVNSSSGQETTPYDDVHTSNRPYSSKVEQNPASVIQPTYFQPSSFRPLSSASANPSQTQSSVDGDIQRFYELRNRMNAIASGTNLVPK